MSVLGLNPGLGTLGTPRIFVESVNKRLRGSNLKTAQKHNECV